MLAEQAKKRLVLHMKNSHNPMQDNVAIFFGREEFS
jgi:hypothetical protein